MRRADRILIAGVLLVAVCMILWNRWGQRTGSTAVIEVDSVIVGTYELSEDVTVEIEGFDGGFNRLVIRDGIASVIDADCPDKLCVHQADIRLEGQTIVCLPHRVVITVRGGESDEIDGIAK